MPCQNSPDQPSTSTAVSRMLRLQHRAHSLPRFPLELARQMAEEVDHVISARPAAAVPGRGGSVGRLILIALSAKLV